MHGKGIRKSRFYCTFASTGWQEVVAYHLQEVVPYHLLLGLVYSHPVHG
jgi:hypothetical protein